MNQKFSVGQCVEYTASGQGPSRYVIVRMMPVEPNQSEPMYRIKREPAGEERVVSECNLDDNVLLAQEYIQMAAAKASLRSKT